MSAPAYDAIIIGAGHNGLTCAAYLGRAGLKVKVIEARRVIGGAAVTEEFHPGFRNSSCSYVVSLLHPAVQRDLQLARHGLTIVPLRQDMSIVLAGPRLLEVGHDKSALARRLDELAPGDGASYCEFESRLTEVADVLRKLALETPPNLAGGMRDLLSALLQGAALRHLRPPSRELLANLLTMSVGDLLDQWFAGDASKALFGYIGSVGNFQSPYAPGSAYVLLHHVLGEATGVKGQWGHAKGGMGAISEAIAGAARAHGVDIETGCPVVQVSTRDGYADGVVLEDGRQIASRIVVSNTHPRLLFDRLLDPGALPAEFRREMRGYRSASGSFRMNVALSELPSFVARPGTHQMRHHEGTILLAPSLDYIERAYCDARTLGFSRRPVVEMWISSTLDDTLAPPGKHVASLFCQHFNPLLADGASWDDRRAAAAEAIIDTVGEAAPNFRAAILGQRLLSPLDLEREFHLVGGDIFHGALHLDQIWSLRPAPGYADYRTPIERLYLCGAGAHPGGGVSGLPGRNAAREVLRDVRRNRRWRTTGR